MKLAQDGWEGTGSREGVMSDQHAWTVIDLLIIFGPVVFFLPTQGPGGIFAMAQRTL